MARTLGATITTEPSPVDSKSNAGGLPQRRDRLGALGSKIPIIQTHQSRALSVITIDLNCAGIPYTPIQLCT